MKAHHICMGGASGSGKTTLLREIHENFEGVSIFVNHNDTSDVAGYRASGRKAMHTAVGKYEGWADVRINLKCDDALEGAELARNFATDVWDTAGVPVQVIVDEAHNAIPDGCGGPKVNAVQWMLAEGRDRGIKCVVATQNPQLMDGDELLNCTRFVWVGEYVQAQKGWLQYYGYPIDDLPREPYKYQVYNRSMERLYSAETKQRHG